MLACRSPALLLVAMDASEVAKEPRLMIAMGAPNAMQGQS